MTTALVCAGGGHLKQLYRLAARFALPEEPVWFTFDTGLSRSLLADRRVVYARYTEPRDVRGVVSNVPLAQLLLREHGVRRVVSTGANIALAFVPGAGLGRLPFHYIESATRVTGPSATGRVLERVPGVHRYTQYASWAGRRWTYAGSVLDDFAAGPTRSAAGLRRVVVTVGTTETYAFRRLVERVATLLPADAEVLWQTGAIPREELAVPGRATVPADELAAAVAEADLVISHAGTGSALTALEAGKCPLLVPRESAHGEHVDDHQAQIARELGGRRLAVTRTVDQLTEANLHEAASRSVTELAVAPPFPLAGGVRA